MPIYTGPASEPTIEDAMAFIAELNDAFQALRAEVDELRASADRTRELQAAMDATQEGGVILMPDGTIGCTQKFPSL